MGRRSPTCPCILGRWRRLPDLAGPACDEESSCSWWRSRLPDREYRTACRPINIEPYEPCAAPSQTSRVPGNNPRFTDIGRRAYGGSVCAVRPMELLFRWTLPLDSRLAGHGADTVNDAGR